MVTKSSREMQKDREKIRPPFGGLKFCQGTHYLPLTTNLLSFCAYNGIFHKQKRSHAWLLNAICIALIKFYIHIYTYLIFSF